MRCLAKILETLGEWGWLFDGGEWALYFNSELKCVIQNYIQNCLYKC